MTGEVEYEEIGPWTEVKLEIIKKYASAYAKILSQKGFYHVYIDAFAGGGVHRSKTSGQFVPGSPSIALSVEPPFNEYHFIEMDKNKVGKLKEIAGENNNVFIYEGDCNEVLKKEVFPRARYEDFRRALCLLDPYGLHLDWSLIYEAGNMRSVDIFLNFPIHDINRNILRRDPTNVEEAQKVRLTRFWGDNSWRDVAYEKRKTLFGEIDEKVTNEKLASAFRQRLKDEAGFANVPEPLAMKNSSNATVYYLFFASQQNVAEHIAKDIFARYA